MLYGVVVFVDICSGDKMDCVLGVLVFEVLEEDGELDSIEWVCDILLMCIVIVMNYGLCNGGGVGDIFCKFFKDEFFFLV